MSESYRYEFHQDVSMQDVNDRVFANEPNLQETQMNDPVLSALKSIFHDLEGDEPMALDILKANALKTEGKSLLVFADSGVGKTHLIGTLPVGKTLIVDVDIGVETLSQTEHDVVRPESFAELKQLYERLRDGALKYRFVAIDSITELEKNLQLCRKHAKDDGKPKSTPKKS